MTAPHEITSAQLHRLIGTPQAPAIIDLRIDQDFDEDPRRLPTAQRFSHTQMKKLSKYIQEHAFESTVIYCQKGRKISQGACAYLRSQNIRAEVLAGGQFAWRDGKFPTISNSPILHDTSTEGSIWVTRHRPKIDRIACPWLIRRFIDPHAQFLFVPPADVLLVAEKFHAIPFDCAGAKISHHQGECSFDALLQEFALDSPALSAMALVIRAADTNQHHLAPQAAGLLALSTGLSRMYRDDTQQLNAGMVFYDALFRWARDAKDESHDSSSGQ